MSMLFQTCVIFILFSDVTLSLRCTNGKCEKNALNIEGYIVGGEHTTIDKFPHAVYLSMVYQKWICGSSILTQWILITAAHCVDGIKGEFQIDAYAGHESLHKVTVIRHVAKFISHKSYHTNQHKECDLALMFLEEAMPIGEKPPIKRVTIRNVYPYTVTVAQVAGWGVTNDAERTKNIYLKSTVQKVLSFEKCTIFHAWKPGLLCAGDSLQNRPSSGDSGNGLMTADYQQIGVVSFRVNSKPEMVFYTNVTYFYDWIVHEATENCIQEEDETKN